ncbi:MAG: phosphoglucosamine mutase [Candidatus Jordarchaeales archaeon]
MGEHVFRAYDIRGVFNQDLDAAFSVKVGLALATYLGGKGTVATGRDVRESSRIVEQALIAGLCSAGCNVVSVGMLPIPTFNFHLWRSGSYKAGAIVTASHNPPHYTGIRFRRPDGTGFSRENQDIKEVYMKGEFVKKRWNELGSFQSLNTEVVAASYQEFLLENISIERPLKVVLDPGCGAASTVAPELFRRAGMKVYTLNAQPDGTFPGRDPHPKEDTVNELRQLTVAVGADMGVAYDGDADRAVFVDDKGRVLRPETAGVILVEEAFSRRKGRVVANISCSMVVKEKVEELGGEVVWERVGDVFITEAIKKHGAVFGIEASGHYYPSFLMPFDDGIYASLLMAEILSKERRPLSTLVDELPSYPITERNIECPDEKKFKVVDRVKEELEREGYEINTIDGVRVDLDDGWFIIRPSNTQPLIRITVEARTESRLRNLLNLAMEAVKRNIERC